MHKEYYSQKDIIQKGMLRQKKSHKSFKQMYKIQKIRVQEKIWIFGV